MTERIRVEVEEELGDMTVTYAAEALSRKDAVAGVMEAIQEYDEVDWDE